MYAWQDPVSKKRDRDAAGGNLLKAVPVAVAVANTTAATTVMATPVALHAAAAPAAFPMIDTESVGAGAAVPPRSRAPKRWRAG